MILQRYLKTTCISWSKISHFLRSTSRFLHDDAANIDTPLNYPIDIPRTVGRFPEEQYRRYLMAPDQPENPKLLRVSIIGEPNGGKSTLVNRLMGWRVNAVSSKVHTTRKNTSGIITEGDTQIVFVDTPGVITPQHRKKHSCDVNMVTDPEESLHEVDAVGVVIDLSDKWTRTSLNKEVLKILHLHPHTTAFLILNKMDTIKKQRVLLIHDVVQRLTYGMIGGEKVGSLEKTNPNVEKGKTINMNASYFKKLESKYGELEHTLKSSQSSVLDASRQALSRSDDVRSIDNVSKNTRLLNKDLDLCDSNLTENMENKVDVNDNTKLVKDDSNVMDKNNESLELEDSYQSEFLTKLRASASSPTATTDQVEKEVSDSWMQKYEAIQKASQNRGYDKFDRVFIVSATEGDGVDSIKDYLLTIAKPGPWEYHSCLVTPQHPHDIAKMCVWQAVLDTVPNRPAYQCTIDITYWQVDENDCLDVVMEIIVDYQMERFVGQLGDTIRNISHVARQALLDAFRCEVSLKLKVTKKSKTSRRQRSK